MHIISAYKTYTIYIGNISGNDCKSKTKDELEANGRQTNENQNIAGSRRRKRGVPFTGVIKEGSSSTTR